MEVLDASIKILIAVIEHRRAAVGSRPRGCEKHSPSEPW
jgi:hypothetical protein